MNVHDLEHQILIEDMHFSQLLKKIIDKYLTLCLYSFGQLYIRNQLYKGKIVLPQHFNMLVLFKSL